MHLQKPVPMGHRIDGWRVCWLGGWDKQRLFFVVMLVRLQPHPSASVRLSHNDPMELGNFIDVLYDSEINCSGEFSGRLAVGFKKLEEAPGGAGIG